MLSGFEVTIGCRVCLECGVRYGVKRAELLGIETWLAGMPE